MERKAKYMPVWGRYVDTFDRLSDKQLGELFRGMLHYHFDGVEPTLSKALSMCWGFIKEDLDNARLSYENKVESGRKGGKRSAQVRSKVKQSQAPVSKKKEPEQITRTESKTESIPESITKKDTGSAPASEEAGVSSEQKAYGEFGWVKLTDSQYRRLLDQMGEATLQACIRYIDQSAQSTGNRNRWKDWYLVLRRCYEEGWHQQQKSAPNHKAPVPWGATGELGPAELEAIQQVLSQDYPDIPLTDHPQDNVSRYFEDMR